MQLQDNGVVLGDLDNKRIDEGDGRKSGNDVCHTREKNMADMIKKKEQLW